MAGSRWRLVPRSGLYLAPTGEEAGIASGVPALALPLPLNLTPLGQGLTMEDGTPILDVPGAAPPWPNDPGVSWTTISDVDAGAARPMSGWSIYQPTGNNATLVTDFTDDPVSPPNGLRINIPVGFGGGGGPEHQEINIDAGNYSRVWLGFTIKLSANFDATKQPGSSDPSGVQKFFHIWAYNDSGVTTMATIVAFGTATSFALQFRNQGFPSGNPRGSPSYNIQGGAATALARGVGLTIEAMLQLNTGSNADGICRAWLNGTQVLNATNLLWNNSGTKRFNKVQYNPTVQNSGWKSNVAQDIRLGHIYLKAAA